jgi:aspartokinase/homoserine dehydrogenase 1
VARNYPQWLASGIHVVTPNKKANSAPLAFYRQVRAAGRTSGAHYLYEATVGAGLPVIQTLRDLRETGDDIESIEGIFSGTLAYLFNVYDGRSPSPRSCAMPSSAVTPSRIRAMTSPARMWRAS